MKRVVVLISGRGSNMKAILDATPGIEVAAVISNNPGAKGLEIAKNRDVNTAVIDHRAFVDRSGFDAALADKVASYQPDLVALAGFMRILTEVFVDRFAGRVLNIHPSLLPAFPGKDTHRRAIEEGVRLHGCTVHFVTSALDHGPIVIQAAVPVLPDDDEERLAARVLDQEHRIYPLAVRWFLDGRLRLEGQRVRIDRDCRYPDPIISPLPQT